MQQFEDQRLVGSPNLGPLADNGGPTQTMALLAVSDAIDAGDDGTCESLDQRGVSRPIGAHCDIGAFELEHPYSLYLPLGGGRFNGTLVQAGQHRLCLAQRSRGCFHHLEDGAVQSCQVQLPGFVLAEG